MQDHHPPTLHPRTRRCSWRRRQRGPARAPLRPRPRQQPRQPCLARCSSWLPSLQHPCQRALRRPRGRTRCLQGQAAAAPACAITPTQQMPCWRLPGRPRRSRQSRPCSSRQRRQSNRRCGSRQLQRGRRRRRRAPGRRSSRRSTSRARVGGAASGWQPSTHKAQPAALWRHLPLTGARLAGAVAARAARAPPPLRWAVLRVCWSPSGCSWRCAPRSRRGRSSCSSQACSSRC